MLQWPSTVSKFFMTFDEGLDLKRQLYFYSMVLEFSCLILYLSDSTLHMSIFAEFLLKITQITNKTTVLPTNAWVTPWMLLKGGLMLTTVPPPASSILLKPCRLAEEPTQSKTCQPLKAPTAESLCDEERNN